MNGDDLAAEAEAEAEAEAGGQTRQRSKVAFPYMDLNAALEVANAIQANVGNGQCSLQQLSAWMGQSIKSSGFRVQVGTARLFGIIESDSTSSYRLSALGRRIVDPESARKAKTDSFLSVPLFRLLFDNHKEGVLPPAAALEREIAGLGVAEKQKDRARQVFDRSAEQAGFFEHGKNRLVMPAIAVKQAEQHKEEKEHSGNGKKGGSGGGPTDELHPFIIGLLKTLPTPESEWSIEAQAKWLQTASSIFGLIYKQKDAAEVAFVDITVKKI